jgi:FkbM family methyltransferase
MLCWLVMKLNPHIRYLGIEQNGHAVIVHGKDSVVTPYTLAMGNYQKEDVEKVLRLAKSHNRLEPGIFLDVGGNIGTTSLYAAACRDFSDIYCFEPVPGNIRVARANIAINDLQDRITLVPKAVSDKSGSLEMSLSASNHGDHRIAATAAKGDRELQSIRIPAISLDEFVGELNAKPRIAFLWIDTQGYEGFVLKGAVNLIEAQRFPICLEFWPYGLNRAGCFDLAIEVLTRHYQGFYDLHDPVESWRPISELKSTADRYVGEYRHTDLLIL